VLGAADKRITIELDELKYAEYSKISLYTDNDLCNIEKNFSIKNFDAKKVSFVNKVKLSRNKLFKIILHTKDDYIYEILVSQENNKHHLLYKNRKISPNTNMESILEELYSECIK